MGKGLNEKTEKNRSNTRRARKGGGLGVVRKNGEAKKG